MCDYPAFVIKTSEGKRPSIKPEDWDDYIEQREKVLQWLNSHWARIRVCWIS